MLMNRNGLTLRQLIPVAACLLSLQSALPTMAQERIPKTITVTGRGAAAVATVKALVNLGVEVQGKSATAVQAEAARRANAVVELLRSRNVENLTTTGVRLNPAYSYENNVQKLTGYIATNTVSFRANTAQMGELLDAAVQAGATRIDSINFIAADSAIAAAQEKALQSAAQDANRQADAVLRALNLTRKEIISIQVNSVALPLADMQPKFAETISSRAMPTPIVGGEQPVEASVTLQISY